MAAINERFAIFFCSEQAEASVDQPLVFCIKVLADVILELPYLTQTGVT
jgi:hypothetical protein